MEDDRNKLTLDLPSESCATVSPKVAFRMRYFSRRTEPLLICSALVSQLHTNGSVRSGVWELKALSTFSLSLGNLVVSFSIKPSSEASDVPVACFRRK